ncbi:MAG: right-handed parallel beta-helix repeat-containing protein [Anaerolineae bacterium]|nr:right-handed parallel beta-helix repeat-containing protein [Anaerolineae bacterium]
MRTGKRLCIVVVFILLSITLAAPAYAGTITVDTLADGTGIPGCSLREAITRANAGSDGEGCTGVTGSPNTIALSLSGSYTLTTGSALPAISSDITIQESGGAAAVIEAATLPNTAAYRVLSVNGTTSILTLNGVTVRNGGTSSTALTGGCILVINAADLILTGGTVVEDCRTSGNGGAIYATTAVNTITVTNSTIQNNTAGGSGGGIYWDSGTVSVSGSTFSGNVAAAHGGGIYVSNNSAFSVSGSTFDDNQANGTGASVNGGAIYWANVFTTGTISSSTFTNNTATGSSNNNGGAIFQGGGGTVEITDSVFTGNSVTGAGGDGGVFFISLGTMRVIGSRIQSNNSPDTARGDVVRVAGGSGVFIVRGSCIVNNGDTAVYGNENFDIIGRDTAGTGENWWGTAWGPQIAGVTGSQYSNGDSINGNGTSSSIVDVGWTSGGDEILVPPTGEWLTSAPTVAGAQCMTCTGASSIGHARSCS